MNTYLLTQLADVRYLDLAHDARLSRQARTARNATRAARRSAASSRRPATRV